MILEFQSTEVIEEAARVMATTDQEHASAVLSMLLDELQNRLDRPAFTEFCKELEGLI